MSVIDQKMEARRHRILEAARGIIETQGYDTLTMRSLAVESGVTVPTIYNLIGNKEQVLFEAVDVSSGVFGWTFLGGGIAAILTESTHKGAR